MWFAAGQTLLPSQAVAEEPLDVAATQADLSATPNISLDVQAGEESGPAIHVAQKLDSANHASDEKLNSILKFTDDGHQPSAEVSVEETEQQVTPRDEAASDATSELDGSTANSTEETNRLPLDARDELRRERLKKCLRFYAQRNLDTGSVSAWSVMHAALSYGVDSRVHRDHAQGPIVSAPGWLCWNGTCRGRRMMYMQNGTLGILEGPGFQGHPGQLLAVLAQCRVGRDYELRVDGQSLTVQDLVEREMETCRVDRELTFKLIGLSHYLKSDAEWQNESGEKWNVPRLLRVELASSLNGVACGGSHRLMGISYSVYKRRLRKEPLDGVWGEAEQRVQKYIAYTYKLQNRDGGFSTQWYQRRADSGDINRKLQTTGHMLEWLVFSLPDEQLDDPRLLRAVDFLVNLMVNNRFNEWENGPRGHAIRALVLYGQRRFGIQTGDYFRTQLARAGQNRRGR